jgi:hypothetical protein
MEVLEKTLRAYSEKTGCSNEFYRLPFLSKETMFAA